MKLICVVLQILFLLLLASCSQKHETPVAESDLYFIPDAQDCELYEDGSRKYTTIWAETNPKVKVPVGNWFSAEYYFKEGDNNNGKYVLTIQPEDSEKIVVFDHTKITHNTSDDNPDGVSDFNPNTLYTSKKLINFMNSQEKTLQIYCDDFKLWENKRPK